MTLPAFENAKLTLRWAREELDKLHEACWAFLGSHPYTLSIIEGSIPGQRVTRICSNEQPGDDLRRASYRITADLRNALDQATYGASTLIGTTAPKKANFPSGQSATDLRARLYSKTGSYKGIPTALHSKFEEFEPFPHDPHTGRGNQLLTTLIEMANPNKHGIPLRVSISINELGIWNMRNVDIESRLLEDGSSLELICTPTGPDPDLKATARCVVAFADYLPGREVCDVFRDMAAMVENIIVDLESRTEQLLRSG